MKFFLTVIVTAAFLSEIVPVWAAAPEGTTPKNQPAAVQTETNSPQPSRSTDNGISITPQAQRRAIAAATAKEVPEEAAHQPAADSSTAPTEEAMEVPAKPAATGTETPKPVIKKIKPPVPTEPPLRVIWPQDFYYYSYNGEPDYSLSLPKDFGSDPVADLPAAGPMLMRTKNNTTMMTFTVADNNAARAGVFTEALKNRVAIPLPPLGPNEEYEYIPAPRYNYPTDPAPLGLPEQLTDVRIVDAGTGHTSENLTMQYLYLSCVIDGNHCMAALTRSERNQKVFEGFFTFPYAEKQNYIPLVTFTAQSLRVRR